MNLIRRTTLRFQDGTSDKVYEVDIVEVSAGNELVNFRYGRSGKPLTEGSKTAAPVDSAKAKKVADSLLVSKMNKGYQVLMGYDPVTGATIGASAAAQPEAAPRKGKKAQSRDQQILERLHKFAADDAITIDGYSLSRSVWKAGELRIPELVPTLQALLAHLPAKVKDDAMTYYSIAWAAGRSKEPAALPLLQQIQDKIPAHLYQFASLHCGQAPENCLPTFDQTLDAVQTIAAIQAFDHYAAMSFDRLNTEDRAYIQQVLHWHGLNAAIEQALSQTVLADADQDFIQLRVDAASYTTIQAGKAAVPELEPAIMDVLRYHYNALLDQKKPEYQADFDLYTQLLAGMNLETVLTNDTWSIARAREGNVQYLWGDTKRNLQNALKATGKVKNLSSLWQRVINYYELHSKRQQDVSAERLQQCYAILKTHDAYHDVVNRVVRKISVDRWFYGYQNEVDAAIRSKYDTALAYHVRRLFMDRFADLRAEALQPKEQLLEHYSQHVVGLYALASIQPNERALAFTAIQHAPVNQSFTASFRKLYKMAEFLDDHAALAILNHRLETTPDEGRRQTWRDENPSFTKQSKQYLRRRTARHLRNLGKFSPKDYLQLAREILVLADDESPVAKRTPKKQLLHFPDLVAMNFILHRHSQRYEQNYTGAWFLQENRQNEANQPEAFATLWAYAGQDLLYILRQCKAAMVNDFALRRLQPQTAFLQEQAQTIWLKLVVRPYENTALLALEYLRDSLQQTEVVFALLNAQFAAIRHHGLANLRPEHFAEHPDLLLNLLLSPHDDVQLFAKNYVYAMPNNHTLLPLLLARPEPALQALGIALIGKLSDAEKREYRVLLFNALTAENAELRRGARLAVLSVKDADFQKDIFAHILPVLFKAEPVDGYSDDMLAIVQAVAPIHAEIDENLLWRLLTAKSKLAERAGAMILPAHPASAFSIKQLAILTKIPTLQVRAWAMTALQADPARVAEQFAEAARILDNRWDDTRAQAIALFAAFDADFWTSERVVAVCDQVYHDVQQFGRELVLRGFQHGEGETYLLQLSQHPANNVQLFVSNFLQEYASGKPATILQLQGYFNTVLSQVNRGRLVKDRVIAFLFSESGKDEQVARMVAILFTDQSLSRVIADKSRYIKTLFELQNRYGIQQTPVRVIAPAVRAF
jgi:predicted DNA-binding WGR domain protein